MTNYPLPTPMMFAVHRRAVVLTQFRWQIVAKTAEATTRLQRIVGDVILPALQQLADALRSVDLDELDDEQE